MTTRRLGSLGFGSALVLAFGAGCIGNIGDLGKNDPNGPGNGPLQCDDGAIHVAKHPLRRLTPTQYANTVRDLFGDDAFEAELDAGGEIVTEREVRQFRDGAEKILGRKSSWTKPVFPCDVDGAGSDQCVTDFIDGFVRRAFRRPVTEAERAWLMGVYSEARSAVTFGEAMETLVQVVVQSPAFIYMFESGMPDASESVHLLSDHEVASRLSYFLWNTMPDDALIGAADRGELGVPEGLLQETQRMLDDPRAEFAVQRFMSSWMQLDGGLLHHPLEEADKDGELYPEFDPTLVESMRTETEAFVKRTFFDEKGSLDDLLSANYAYVNGPMAKLYGVAGPADASTWEWVDLDAKQRAGILTRSAFLTVLSTKSVTAPIRRGVWVLEELLCTELGEPPANANNVAVEGGVVDGELRSVREDVAARTNGGDCNACHDLINPIGFAFENYDAIGRWQVEEVTSGLTVDSSGYLATSGDQDGEIQGAVDLSTKLGASKKARGCFAERWYQQAIGEELDEQDKCSLDTIQSEFAEGGSMRDLVAAIIASDAFRYVNVSEDK